MHCILIGVYPPTTNGEIWNKLTQQLSTLEDTPIIWISSSIALDEDGKLTQLVCATTDASVDEVVEATSKLLGSEYNCELWASAPAILPLKPQSGYGKQLYYYNNDVSWEEWAPNAMKEWGMFVQNQLLNTNEVHQLRRYVCDEISNAESLLRRNHPEISIGKDIIAFKQIASRGNERFDLLLQPLSLAGDFVQCVVVERVSFMLEKVLGSQNEVNFDVSVVYSKPGAPNQGWHSDGDHQKGSKDAGWKADGWKSQLADPYALCLFIPLIDLDDATGYTQFWPASHRNRDLMGFGTAAEITEATWNGKCKAGDAIWYDYRLMHRGMANQSTVLRPVVQVLFKRKWYVERRNYGVVSIDEYVSPQEEKKTDK
jgi:hypothetical protein|mmetsp:Transcript_6296/g.13988  ORF Transcript_6296/g.13988 Transcript_6296/m.13988 type:complete len:371 (-) Transcript_6296:34-1146(-)